MDYSADIQEFDRLRTRWYEASLTSAEEQRLYELASRLLEQGTPGDPDRMADAMMLAAASRASDCTGTHYKAVEFAATLDRMVTTRRRKSPLSWISVAASVALIAGIGFTLFRNAADKPAMPAGPTAPALTAQYTPHPAAPANPAPAVATTRLRSMPNPASKPTCDKCSKRADDVATETEQPEQPEQSALREITDLDEASCLISQTCLVLGSSLALAQDEAQGAITELEINLNYIN